MQISCDGGAATGKTTGAKMISKKYNLKFLSSGLLYRYASYLILKFKPKNKILFLQKNFKKLNYKKLNKINAIYLLRRGISLLTYNLFIGREINFRKKDFSSIYSYQDPRIYIRRAKFAKEGDNVFKNLKRKKMNIPIMIHWGVNASNLLFETFSNICRVNPST